MAAQRSQPIIAEQVHRMTFAISGATYTEDNEKRLYEAIRDDKHGGYSEAMEFVAAWCNHTGFKWGSISIAGIHHHKHGNNGEYGGHYCITALITDRIEEESQ